MKCFMRGWDPLNKPLGGLQPTHFSIATHSWLFGNEASILADSPIQLMVCVCIGATSECEFAGHPKIVVGVANTWTDPVNAHVTIRQRRVHEESDNALEILSIKIQVPVSFSFEKERAIAMYDVVTPTDDGLMWEIEATVERLDLRDGWVNVSTTSICRQLFCGGSDERSK